MSTGGRARDGWIGDAAIVGALSVVFVGLFVLLREVPFHYDPVEYFRTAQSFESVAPFHRSLRIGLLAPVRLAQVAFGYSQAAYYAVPMASGVLLLGSTYALGRVVASRWVGAAAAVLVTFTTPVFGSVHQLWPDLPAAAVFTAGMAATTVLCKRHGAKGGGVEPSPWAYLAFLAAGALVGGAYLIREFTVVLFPVVLIPFWQYRTPWRYVLVGAVGALAALVGELAFNARFHDDAFIRIRDLVTVLDEPPPEHVLDVHAARTAERGGFLERLAVFPQHLMTGRVPLLAGAGVAALVSPLLVGRRQGRAVIALLGWLLFYWALVLYLSLDVDQYGRALHIEKIRYWYPVLPPLAVAGCIGVAAAVGRVRHLPVRRGLAVVLGLVVVLGVGADFVGRVAALGAGEPHPYEQVRRWLATDGAAHDSLATTQRTRWIFEMYTHAPFGDSVWEGGTQGLNGARRFIEQEQVRTDLVLVDDTFFEAPLSNWREVTPDWLLDLPDDWRPVAASDDGELVVYERQAEPLAMEPVAAAWSSDHTAMVVAEDGTTLADLDEGQRATLSLRVEPDAGAGAVVLTQAEITTDGDTVSGANVVPFCFMVGADGRSVRKDASSLWGVGFDGPRRVQAACTVPLSLEPPVDVRLGLAVRGPMDLEVGPAEHVTVQTTTDWRTPD